MRRLTANNLVTAINQLNKKVAYNYISPKNKGLIMIESIDLPEGPIRIKRWDPSKGENENIKKTESISSELIWRIANAYTANQPLNFDRVLGGSYNTRSVFEALLAHTPEFYYSYPGRIENTGGKSNIVKGHKHIKWEPDNPHKIGAMFESKNDHAISEVPSLDVTYDALELPTSIESPELTIEIKRRHAQIQIALYFIGKQLNFRTWIAQNDKGIIYKNKKIGEFEGVIDSLKNENLMTAFDEAIRAALMIDCMWFKNGKLMPAVMEIEHSTGVTSGLTRMKNFKEKFPPFPTRYVIVAADDDRDKVIREASKPQFKDLNTRFFPYSAVEELYALCERRKLKGITEEFLDCYMEPILN